MTGRPVNPQAKGACLHPLKYRFVRAFDLSAADSTGVEIDRCDYCGLDLKAEAEAS